MRRSRFADSQILAILKQAEAGAPVTDLCREYGISETCLRYQAQLDDKTRPSGQQLLDVIDGI